MRVAVGIAVAVVLALAGCTTAPAPDETSAPLPRTLDCGGVPVPSTALTEPVSASTLDPAVVAGIVGSGMLDGSLADWHVVSSDPGLVMLTRQIPAPYDSGGGTEIQDYSLVTFGTPPAVPSPNDWSLYREADCAMRIGLPQGLTPAHLSLDPDHLPKAGDTTVHLYAYEQGCSGSRTAEDRLEVVSLVESRTSVDIVVGVAPRVAELLGCAGNPPTRFTVDLSSPLGDRQILDAAVVPSRQLRNPAQPVAPAILPPALVYCEETAIPAKLLTDPIPTSTLDPAVAAGIDGSGWLQPPLSEWSVVAAEPTTVTLVRELPEPEDYGAGEIRTHALVSFSTGPAALTSPTAWSLYRDTMCDLRVALPDDLGAASITLDPDNPAGPDDRVLHLLAWERACASGQPAGDRLEVVDVVQTFALVQVVVGVRQTSGACPSNPPTPFTIELSERLGDRAIVDAAVYPARPITAG